MNEIEEIRKEGYQVIDPEANGIKAILAELGYQDLDPGAVERLCQTAKCPTLNGFIRFDALPCGCSRQYRGMITGHAKSKEGINIFVGGIEGVKPCGKHRELVESIKYRG